MNTIRLTLLALVLTQLTGCMFLDWMTNNSEPKPVAAAIPDKWKMTGRIGVIHGEEGWHGKMSWQQNKQDFTAGFFGPFGGKGAEFISKKGKVELRSPSGKSISGKRLEAWQKDNFGALFPIKALPYWLHGHPDPKMKNATVKGELGAAEEISQGKWIVRYSRWKEFKGRVMPAKVVLIHRDLRMKLILDSYQRS